MTCTFFGNRVIYRSIDDTLEEVLIDLIENKGVTLFYVGNHGKFDAMVLRHLKKLSIQYPIKYWVVVAYIPKKAEKDQEKNILYPSLEHVPPRYAIVKRNEWMLERADYVVAFIDDITGNAERMREKALKKGKTVINVGRF